MALRHPPPPWPQGAPQHPWCGPESLATAEVLTTAPHCVPVALTTVTVTTTLSAAPMVAGWGPLGSSGWERARDPHHHPVLPPPTAALSFSPLPGALEPGRGDEVPPCRVVC